MQQYKETQQRHEPNPLMNVDIWTQQIKFLPDKVLIYSCPLVLRFPAKAMFAI